jgi:hypothetical protein
MVTNTLIIYAVAAVLLVAWVLAIIMSVRRVLNKDRQERDQSARLNPTSHVILSDSEESSQPNQNI